jgi:hypothetical protein
MQQCQVLRVLARSVRPAGRQQLAQAAVIEFHRRELLLRKPRRRLHRLAARRADIQENHDFAGTACHGEQYGQPPARFEIRANTDPLA